MAEPLHFDEELLIRYIDGDLSAGEKELVESALNSSPDLQKKLHDLQLAIFATRRLGDIEKVKNVHQQMMQEFQSTDKRTPVRKMIRLSVAVAASILLVFFTWRYFQSAAVDANRMYNQAYVEFDVNATRNQDQKTEIQKAYASKEYNRISKLVPVSEMDSLLIALSYLHQNQTVNAISLLQVLQKGNGEYQPDAEFYLSLAYLKNKEYGKAYELAQSIHNNPRHLYKDQFSDSFIKQLDELNQQNK